MPSPLDDPDVRLSQHASGLQSFPTEDDEGQGPEPGVVLRPWVTLSIVLVSLLMLACAFVLGRMH
jgi:hypothetical protein